MYKRQVWVKYGRLANRYPGFSPDPVLSGICVAQTVKGIQDSGVIATTKHYIGLSLLQARLAWDMLTGTQATSKSTSDRTVTTTVCGPSRQKKGALKSMNLPLNSDRHIL